MPIVSALGGAQATLARNIRSWRAGCVQVQSFRMHMHEALPPLLRIKRDQGGCLSEQVYGAQSLTFRFNIKATNALAAVLWRW